MSSGRAASIQARLLAGAKARGEEFNLTLMRYALERFLYRISLSPARDQLWLKGAMLFSLWFDAPHRPTRDADFLGLGAMDALALAAAVAAACSVQADDGMTFDPTSITIEFGMANSRMKDYFDLLALVREGTLQSEVLARAIAATFARRRTALPADVPLGLSDAFAQDGGKRKQWRAFLQRNKLEGPELDDVVSELRKFFAEPLRRAAAV